MYENSNKEVIGQSSTSTPLYNQIVSRCCPSRLCSLRNRKYTTLFYCPREPRMINLSTRGIT
jgi:hypothetical protein